MFFVRLKRGYAAFAAATTVSQRILGLIFLVVFGILVTAMVVSLVSEAGANWKFNHMPPAAHLNQAKAVCGPLINTSEHICSDPVDALHHLEGIPASASEYAEASKLIASIQQQEHSAVVEADQNTQRQLQQYQLQSHDQMLRNVQGLAHDDFMCTTSTGNKEIMSFDDGNSWWVDDGRCAAREQAKRNADAQIYSYWSTTLRVNTDMDSSWLPAEERTCQTYPDGKGKISMVACNPTGSHQDHNIPVKFYGGVNRNTVSDWKCRREKDLLDDEFVCWAID